MITTPEEPTAGISFPPGSFVHPTRRLGHLAHVLMTVDPANVDRLPVVGYTYAVIVCPQFSLPPEFPLMSREEQRAIILRLEAVQTIRTDTLTAVENVGLKLISDEWLRSRSSGQDDSELENTEPDAETGTPIVIP